MKIDLASTKNLMVYSYVNLDIICYKLKMEPFKNIFNQKSISTLANEIEGLSSDFNKKLFIKESTKDLDSLEMKERVNQITLAIHNNLGGSIRSKLSMLAKVSKSLEGFIIWPLTTYVEDYGRDDYDSSMKALYIMTQNFTSEFGIRIFLELYPNESLELLKSWAKDRNHHVRRLVSEGTRPNLPWGKKVQFLSDNPKKTITLLNMLKDDPQEYVRKSVANHMNDITRIHPKLALETLRKWNKSPSKELQWIIKHALRSLLKMGNKDALELLGYNPKAKVNVENFRISKQKIKEGDSFDIDFDIISKQKNNAKIMVDYIIHYPKKNGELSPKTFKLKATTLKGKESIKINKTISFKKVTTRVHYPGIHFVEVMLNGKVMSKIKFELKS